MEMVQNSSKRKRLVISKEKIMAKQEKDKLWLFISC